MNKYLLSGIRVITLVMLMFQLTLPIAFSQTAGLASADPAEQVTDLTLAQRYKPHFYPSGGTMSPAEMHKLGPLTVREKKIIEEAVDPPAIGVVRELQAPIKFKADAGSIPSQGAVPYAGGRMFRLNADTVVWTTSIQSAAAEELRIWFSEGNFPAGVVVNLFSENDYAFNQYELSGKLNEYGFYTTTTFASQVTLQVVIPVVSLSENLYFNIPALIHANRPPVTDATNTGCFEDVNCPYANTYPNIGALKGSTAKLSFVSGGGYYICTGGLLNDFRATDVQPYLLTANHCFSTQASAASLEARFDLYTTSCNGSINPNIILVNGSNLLATNSQSDFTMVLLNSAPGGFRWYLGWTNGGLANDVTVHSVHHPDGTPQKYVRGLNKTSPDYICGQPVANFHYTRAVGGATLGGSSGGNVVNPAGQVVGQLYGKCYSSGFDECNYPTYHNVWGKFEVSYNNNNLQYWLANGGATASIYVPVTSMNYGTCNAGTWYYQTVTVYNSGFAPNYLNVEASSSLSGANASEFSIIGNTYLYLSPGTSGTFTVRFNPTSSGAKTASLNITHNADNALSPIVVALSGNVEPCSNIISLGTGGEANTMTYSKSGTGLWYTTWASVCGFNCPGNEQIYSFVAPYTGNYSIQVTSTNSNWVDYMWKSGVCDGGSWICFDDAYSPGTYGSASWTAGETYYILLDAESTTLTTHTFFIFLNPCLNITAIGGTGAANSAAYTGGGTGAWFTSSQGACGFYCPGVEQVYSFTAPYSGYYTLQVTATTEYYVDYSWSTSCGSAGWNCIDDVNAPGIYGPMYWTAGTTYYILADDENSIAGPQTFHINPPEPCYGIEPIACGEVKSYSAVGAGVWNTFYCWYTPGAERIYSFVAPYTGQYSIQVNGADSWVDYLWKEGSCSSTDWNCIAYVLYPGQYGSMTWTAGHTYYIMLDDEDEGLSQHSFSIVCPALCHTCPTYDFPVDPTEAWQTQTSSTDIYGCKIFRFYAYYGTSYTFKTGCGDGASADFDTYLALYDGSCTLITANDDGCSTPESKIEWTATSSGYHYVKVMGMGAQYGNFTLAYNYCYFPPAQPGPIAGPPVIGSAVGETYSIDAVPGATSYIWNYNGTGTVSGTGTTAVLTATGDGTLSVIAYNICGGSYETTREITVIPVSFTIVSGTLIPGVPVCMAATQTIVVAGSGFPVTIPNGGILDLVAGMNIFLMPGLVVQSGAYFHGRIDNDGTYCTGPVTSKSNLLVVDEAPGLTHSLTGQGDGSFKVYPNPTTGEFTLELTDEPGGNLVRVQCFNMMGSSVMESKFESGRVHKFNLTGQKPGMYVIKVIQNDKSGMQKMIKL